MGLYRELSLLQFTGEVISLLANLPHLSYIPGLRGFGDGETGQAKPNSMRGFLDFAHHILAMSEQVEAAPVFANLQGTLHIH